MDDFEFSKFQKKRSSKKVAEDELKNFEEIKEFLDFKNKKVLDIGCGAGYLISELEKNGNKCMGIDILKKNPFNINKKIVDLDRENIELEENSFDVVIMNNVLEHLSRPVKIMTLITTVLKKNGFALISIPNEFSLRNKVDIIRSKTPGAHQIDAFGHKCFANRKDWGKFFAEYFSKVELIKKVPFKEKSIVGFLSNLLNLFKIEMSYKTFIYKCTKPLKERE